MVWVHPKTIKTVSSTTGALVGVGSLKPKMDYPSNCEGPASSFLMTSLQKYLAIVSYEVLVKGFRKIRDD
jgi:hypothetical protein